MKTNILYTGVCLATLLLAGVSCGDDKIDNSAFDEELGKDFNQEVIWDEDSLAFYRADWDITSYDEGAELRTAQIEMLGTVQSVSYLTYAPAKYATKLAVSDTPKKTSDFGTENEAYFAINGSVASAFKIFEEVPVSAGASDGMDGIITIDKNFDTYQFTPQVRRCQPSEYENISTWGAMAAGPMLIVDGVKQTFENDTERKARSVVGTLHNGDVIMMTVDGGVAGQADGATLSEAAYLAGILHMEQAVCLEEGNASTLWASDKGVVNHPSGNGAYDNGGEAEVTSVLYVSDLAKEKPQPLPLPTGKEDFTGGGSGTQDDPYIIRNATDLMCMKFLLNNNSTLVDDGTDGAWTYFELAENIDMAVVPEWEPLNSQNPNGSYIGFDGKGHILRNFTCNKGCFISQLTGYVKNVYFKNAYVEGSTGSAAVVAGATRNYGPGAVLENVAVDGTVKYMNSGDASPAAGLVGYTPNTDIRNCYVNVTVERPAGYHANSGWAGTAALAGRVLKVPRFENNFIAGRVNGEGDCTGAIVGLGDGDVGDPSGDRPAIADRKEMYIRNNIVWCSELSVNNASYDVASLVGGYYHNRTWTSSDNYARSDMNILEDGAPRADLVENAYSGMDCQYETTDPIATARALGWSEDYWDLSGETPILKICK